MRDRSQPRKTFLPAMILVAACCLSGNASGGDPNPNQERHPFWSVIHAKNAMNWSHKKEFEKALMESNEAIRLDPRSALAYVLRSGIWSAKEDYDKAILDCQEALRIDPKLGPAYAARGMAHIGKDDYDLALADFEEVVRLSPKGSHGYAFRASAWSFKKDYDKAIADYTEAIRIRPTDGRDFSHRGEAWAEKGEYEKAIADYDRAIRLRPRYADAYVGRGNVRVVQQQYGKALADYDRAIRIDPTDSRAYFRRSVVEFLLHRREAIGDAKTARELDGWKHPRSIYAVIFGAFAARMHGEEKQSHDLLVQAAARCDTAAWPYPAVRFLRGEIDEAALMALAVDDDKKCEARCYLGLDEMLKGRTEQARDHFRWVQGHADPLEPESAIATVQLRRSTTGSK